MSTVAEAESFVGPGGLRVILRRIEGTPAIATCLHIPVGCRNEPLSGIAHLAEHLLGSPVSLGENSTNAVFAMGGRANARTSLDYTQFTHILPRRGLGLAIERELDRVTLRLMQNWFFAE
ncbi:insulinase family protein [Rathayibacter tritici]|uniref:insulinase family protein n=1 Tax=Rathayibacter tritici TaxID=33888 RepID=UPI000A079DFF